MSKAWPRRTGRRVSGDSRVRPWTTILYSVGSLIPVILVFFVALLSIEHFASVIWTES